MTGVQGLVDMRFFAAHDIINGSDIKGIIRDPSHTTT